MGYRNDPLLWELVLPLAEEKRLERCDAETLGTLLVALYDLDFHPGRWFLERWVMEVDVKLEDLEWEMVGRGGAGREGGGGG
jgi:hypothetical protein